MYRGFAKDENIQVRKAASFNLKFLIANVPKYPETEAINLFQLLYKDEQDIVRFSSVDNMLALAQAVAYPVCLQRNRVCV